MGSMVLETFRANIYSFDSFDWDVLEVCKQPSSTLIVSMFDCIKAGHTLFASAVLKASTVNVA